MIPEAGDENDGIPLAVRAVYGYGDVTMIVPIDGGKPHVEWQSRPTITKKSGSPISTRVFVDGVVPHVSALLFSACATPNVPIQIASHLGEEWRDLVLIHNPTATNRLPRGWLRIGREYWVEGDRIRIKDWRAHTRVQRGWRWLRWRLGALRRSRRAV